MNRDDIIRMALECDGVPDGNGGIIADCMDIDLFASLVAAAEREECAKLCEQGLNIMTSDSALEWMEVFGEKFAAAIRARGQS